MLSKSWVSRYAVWIIEHRLLVILLSILSVVPAYNSIVSNIKFETDYRVFFSSENEQLKAFEHLENTYSKNDNVMIVVTPPEGTVFTKKSLKAIQYITEQAWLTPYATRVDSLANFQYSKAGQDEIIIENLISTENNLDNKEISRIKAIALQEPRLINKIISPTGHVTGINITVQLPSHIKGFEIPVIATYTRELKSKAEQKFPGLDIKLSGMVFFNNAFAESSQQDMQTLVLYSFAAMLLALIIMLRSITGMIATFFVIIFSIIIALGIGLYIGFPITPPSAIAPNIVLTVAIANSVHILVNFFSSMKMGKKLAMIESLKINMQPVFIASITTALGFLSMNFSDAPPFAHLGNMVAIGVVASFIFSVSFVPAFMTLFPFKYKVSQRTNLNSLLMQRLGHFVVKRSGTLILFIGILSAVFISFIPNNQLNDNFLYYFDEDVEFRKDTEYFTDNLSGVYLIDYSLDSGQAGGISDPKFLKDVEKFAQWYRQQPEVKYVSTITDVIKTLNKNLHEDNKTWYQLPQNRDLSAQYLLLYEMSLPYGLDLNNQINIDKSATRFTVSLESMSSNQLISLEKRAQLWLSENTRSIKQHIGSGGSIMFAHLGKRNIESMLIGTTSALFIISLILIAALKSVKIGLISLLPNLIPSAIGFGLWGLFVGEVSLALSIVAGMTLGIVVDDTVHFLSKYLRARRENNATAEEAIKYCFDKVGMALLTTTIVLVIGFIILAQSTFKQNADMGMLTAIVISLALLADFLLLPAILMRMDKRNN